MRNLKQVEKKRKALHQKAVVNDPRPFFLNNTKPIKNAEEKRRAKLLNRAPFNGRADLWWAASLQKCNRYFNFCLRNKSVVPATFLQLLSWINVLSKRGKLSCSLLFSFINKRKWQIGFFCVLVDFDLGAFYDKWRQTRSFAPLYWANKNRCFTWNIHSEQTIVTPPSFLLFVVSPTYFSSPQPPLVFFFALLSFSLRLIFEESLPLRLVFCGWPRPPVPSSKSPPPFLLCSPRDAQPTLCFEYFLHFLTCVLFIFGAFCVQ